MKNGIISSFLVVIFAIGCKKAYKSEVNSSEKVLYEVVFRENLAGKYEKWPTGENSFEFYYTYTDRGRGPEYSEKITLNDQNFISKQTIKGVNYRKVPVDEKFSTGNSAATWSNPKESTQGDFYGSELYFRYDGSPAVYEILARLLITSPDKKVELYPRGLAELVEIFPQTLSDSISLDLLMIKGLDMNPTYLWMDGNEMIASISGNLHVIREDYKEKRTALKKLQDSVEDAYLMDITQKLTVPIEKVVIQNVNVFTPEGKLLPNQDVFVDGETIEAVRPSAQKKITENTRIINGEGKTLMPGMFDMHTHNSKFRGLLHVAGGITSVRDLANNKQLKALSAQFNSNEIIGPRIVTFCGIIDGPGPYANQRNVVDNLEEGLAEIQVYKDLGYDQIKLYSSIKPEWVKPMADKAHELGMRVCGHIPSFMTASQAIDQGYDEIQHMNMLFLNFLSDTIDTRTPLRFTMVAQHGANLDLTSKEYLDFVDLLKKNDILIDPTISIFENMFVSQKGQPSPTYNTIMNRLPIINQRAFYAGGLPKNEETTPLYKRSHDNMLNVVHDLFQKGVDIVPGTDGLPGFLYHRELELYEKSGIPASEVLKLATITSAKLTGVSEEYGSIVAGKKADLVLIDGNPVDTISDIRNVEWTMKGGNLYYAKELYESMGIRHFN
nr:amidohydrolase family protein [uncultured Allomuricauda sp.]